MKEGSSKPLILLTNDDGFFAQGIKTLADHLQDLGEVYIIAPYQETSATSLALTLHHPLRVHHIDSHLIAVEGTPADCVYMACQLLLPRLPDILLSGINHGPNVGQQDIAYSGTVAGAIQGTFLRIPSAALSLYPDKKGQFDFDYGAKIGRLIAEFLLFHSLPERITLNVNIPAPPPKGIKLAKLGEKRYNPEIITKIDPRGRTYYWIGTGNPRAVGDRSSDVHVIQEGYITLTPLQRDLTAFELLEDNKFHQLWEKLSKEKFDS